jgi:hypothetical protein
MFNRINYVDWDLLQIQKEHLVAVIYDEEIPDTNLLEGLLEFIDAVQDDADDEGLPVYK